jgi:hypothetical protein
LCNGPKPFRSGFKRKHSKIGGESDTSSGESDSSSDEFSVGKEENGTVAPTKKISEGKNNNPSSKNRVTFPASSKRKHSKIGGESDTSSDESDTSSDEFSLGKGENGTTAPTKNFSKENKNDTPPKKKRATKGKGGTNS